MSHGALGALVAALVLLTACGSGAAPGPAGGVITVGSFNFPESVLLGEILTQLLVTNYEPTKKSLEGLLVDNDDAPDGERPTEDFEIRIFKIDLLQGLVMNDAGGLHLPFWRL